MLAGLALAAAAGDAAFAAAALLLLDRLEAAVVDHIAGEPGLTADDR